MAGVIKHLVAAYKRAVGLQRPGKSLVILPDDVFLVSFPKSGSNNGTRQFIDFAFAFLYCVSDGRNRLR